MPRITMQIEDCTPEEARMIAAYIEHLGARPADNNVRSLDVERTAAAVAPMITPPSPPVAFQQPVHHVAPTPGPAYNPPAPPSPAKQATTGALDVRGVPWHSEYHAATQGVNNDGSWKKKKGGDKHATSAYELRYIGRPGPVTAPTPPAAPQPPVSPPAPPAQAAPVAPPTAAETTAKFAPHLAPTSPPVMAPPAPPPAPNGEIPMPSYAEFYAVYMQLCEQGRASAADFERIHQAAGVASPAEYISDEPKRMVAYLEFQKLAA